MDGKPATTGTWVEAGQKIELMELELTPPKPYSLSLSIIFEDDCLAVIYKPPGIVVSGNRFRTIQNALAGNLKSSFALDSLPWPQPVHRLDAATSGLLIIAKTRKSRIDLGKQFQNKEVVKRYHAIVMGKMPAKGSIDSDIDNKPALTTYRFIESVPSLKNDWLTLVELCPKTGRTHQLRIHLSQLGFPILGDKLYGKEGQILKGKGLFLSATGLQFKHPLSHKTLDFSIDIPGKFQAHLSRELRRWKKYHTK